MLCYKDKTFCKFYIDCYYGDICTAALTEKIKADAQEFGLPICEYVDRPECFHAVSPA